MNLIFSAGVKTELTFFRVQIQQDDDLKYVSNINPILCVCVIVYMYVTEGSTSGWRILVVSH